MRPASTIFVIVALLAAFNVSASQSYAWSVQGSTNCDTLPCFNTGELAGSYACTNYYGSSLKTASSYYTLGGDVYYYVCQSGAGSSSKKINNPCPVGQSWNDIIQRCDVSVDCSGKKGQTIETRYGAIITDVQASGDLSGVDIGSQNTVAVDGCEAIYDDIKYCGLYKTTILGESYFYCDYIHRYTGKSSSSVSLPPSEGSGLPLTDQITFEPPTTTTTTPPVVTPGPPSITEQQTVTVDGSTESATVTSESGTSYTLIINRGGNKTTYVTTTTVVQSNGTTTTTSTTNVVYTSNETTSVTVDSGSGTTTTTTNPPVVVSGGSSTTTTTTSPDGGTTTTTNEEPPAPGVPCDGRDCSTVKIDESGVPSGDSSMFNDQFTGIGFDEYISGLSEDPGFTPLDIDPLQNFPAGGGCQTLTMTFFNKSITIPSADGCSRLHQVKEILSWFVYIMTVYTLVMIALGIKSKEVA